MKITQLIIIVTILLVLSVSFVHSDAAPAVAGFVRSSIVKLLPEPARTIYSVTQSPTEAAKQKLIGALPPDVQESYQNMEKSYSAATDPAGAAQSQMWQETYKNLDPATKQAIDNVQEYAPYAQQAFAANPQAKNQDERMGTFSCNGDTNKKVPPKSCSVTKPDGTKYMQIPSSYDLSRDKEGNLLLKNQKGEKGEILVGDFVVSGVPKDAVIKIKENTNCQDNSPANAPKCIALEVSSGTVTFQDQKFENIKDGNFKVSKSKDGKAQQIEYAEFTSSKPSLYTFEHNNQKFEIATTKANSKVLFNPKNNVMEAENVEWTMGNISLTSSKATFELDKGSISKISVAADAVYEDKDLGLKAKSTKPFELYVNKELDKDAENALSIIKSDEKVNIHNKGIIDYTFRETRVAGNGESRLEYNTNLLNPDANPNTQTLSVESGFFNVQKDNLKIRLEHSEGSGETTVLMDRDSLRKSAKKDTDWLDVQITDKDKISFSEKGQLLVDNEGNPMTSSDDSYIEQGMTQCFASEGEFA